MRDTEPDCGLITLIIGQHQDLDFHLQTRTAKRLWQRGARLYLMTDGTTHALSLKRPRGSYFRAIALNLMQTEIRA